MTPVPENPYVGLRPFETQHSGLFFGRRAQTAELLDALRRDRFLAVVGTSGCGKSSLVRAGLLPALRGGFLVAERDRWRVAAMKPGSVPLQNLAAALCGDEDVGAGRVEELREALAEDPFEAVESFLPPRLGARTSLLLLVDQFEEIFPYREAEGEPQAERTRRRAEADDFVHLLLRLVDRSKLPVYVVLTMRSDFLGDCDVFFGLPEAMNRGRYLVPRLERRELREAIEGPARRCRVEVAPRLTDRLLNELGDRTDRLPVLQHVLLRTWERWAGANDGPMDLEHYGAVGTLRDALARHAEEALEVVNRELAAKIFQRLADTDPHGRRVRRAASFGELVEVCGAEAEEVEAVIERFRADGRHFLAIADAPEPSERRVEISHESLIRQWPTLQGWVDEERVARDLFLELVDRARRAEADEGDALLGRDLVRFQEWNDKLGPKAAWARRYSRSESDLNDALAFLDESAKAQGAARRRNARLLWGLAGGTLIVVVALILLSSWALHNSARAKDLARLAVARETLEKDPTTAALVLVEVKEADDVALAPALMRTALDRQIAEFELRLSEKTLSTASFSATDDRIVAVSDDGTVLVWDFLAGVQSRIVLEDPGDEDPSASSSVSGNLIVTAPLGGTARVWDLSNPQSPVVLGDYGDGVLSVSFSASGDRVVTASLDGAVRIWDVSGPKEPLSLRGPVEKVRSASISPSGGRVVTTSSDGIVRVWDLFGSGEPVLLDSDGDRDLSASFSPAGDRVATAASDGTVRIWDLSGSEEPVVLEGHSNGVLSVSFSPSGDRLITASLDGTARVWDLSGSQDSVVLEGHGGWILSASFSPSGDRVVTASDKGTVRVWNLSGALDPVVLKVHGGWVLSAAFSPSGDRVVTASYDGLARVWDLSGAEEPIALVGHSEGVASASFSPLGDRVVTASLDGTVRVWDLSNVREPVVLPGHSNWVLSASFSNAGDHVVSASLDNTVRVWDASGVEEPVVLEGHDDWVFSASFSPSGDRVVSASLDGTVRVWDLSGGQHTIVLREDDGFSSASFSPSGDHVLTVSRDGTVKILDLLGVQEPVVLEDNHSGVRSASYSPSGDRVVTASTDGTARVWDLVGVRRPMVLEGHLDWVRSASFSPSGDRVVTASDDGTVRVWSLLPEDLRTLLRRSSRICLEPELRVGSLGESPEEAYRHYEECGGAQGYRPASGGTR